MVILPRWNAGMPAIPTAAGQTTPAVLRSKSYLRFSVRVLQFLSDFMEKLVYVKSQYLHIFTSPIEWIGADIDELALLIKQGK